MTPKLGLALNEIMTDLESRGWTLGIIGALGFLFFYVWLWFKMGKK